MLTWNSRLGVVCGGFLRVCFVGEDVLVKSGRLGATFSLVVEDGFSWMECEWRGGMREEEVEESSSGRGRDWLWWWLGEAEGEEEMESVTD